MKHLSWIILLSVVCSSAEKALATPAVFWSRPNVKRMLIPGQTATELVTFTASGSTSKVSVTVVAALQPFLKVSPTGFSTISAGKTYSVTLSLAVPNTIAVGTLIDGTVQLTSGVAVLAQPLPVALDIEAASSRSSDPGSIVQDGQALYPVNEIVLTLSPGSNFSLAQSIASTIPGVVVGALPEIDTYRVLVNTTTVKVLTALIQKLRTNPPSGVIAVSRNYAAAAPSVEPTDLENLAGCTNGSTETIAYASVRSMDAWRLLRLLNPGGIPRHVTVGLLDTGVQTVIGTTSAGTVFHPEFSGPPVDFGNTPQESLVDTSFQAGDPQKQGHGTEVAGIVGANNRSDPTLGLDYQCPAMNGVLSGVPNILGRYTLEERIGPSGTITTQMADAISAITSGARIVLLEMEITAKARLSLDQLNSTCDIKGVLNDLVELEVNYRRWWNLFKVHPDVLFVLPAANYGQSLPSLTSEGQFADVVSLVGGINRDNNHRGCI